MNLCFNVEKRKHAVGRKNKIIKKLQEEYLKFKIEGKWSADTTLGQIRDELHFAKSEIELIEKTYEKGLKGPVFIN